MSPNKKGPTGYRLERSRAKALRRPPVRAAYDDREDLAAFEERANEPVVSYRRLLKELKVLRGRGSRGKTLV